MTVGSYNICKEPVFTQPRNDVIFSLKCQFIFSSRVQQSRSDPGLNKHVQSLDSVTSDSPLSLDTFVNLNRM